MHKGYSESEYYCTGPNEVNQYRGTPVFSQIYSVLEVESVSDLQLIMGVPCLLVSVSRLPHPVSKETSTIDGDPITSIAEKPVRYLGKQFNKSLNEQQQIEEAMKECNGGLKKIDKCKLPGNYKAWMLQYMLLAPKANVASNNLQHPDDESECDAETDEGNAEEMAGTTKVAVSGLCGTQSRENCNCHTRN